MVNGLKTKGGRVEKSGEKWGKLGKSGEEMRKYNKQTDQGNVTNVAS